MHGAVRKSYRNFAPTNPFMASPSSWIKLTIDWTSSSPSFARKSVSECDISILTYISQSLTDFRPKSKTARSLELAPTFLSL